MVSRNIYNYLTPQHKKTFEFQRFFYVKIVTDLLLIGYFFNFPNISATFSPILAGDSTT